MKGKDICISHCYKSCVHGVYICECNYSIFQTFSSRHIHKEIKLQKSMNGIDKFLCKTDHNLIRQPTYI